MRSCWLSRATNQYIGIHRMPCHISHIGSGQISLYRFWSTFSENVNKTSCDSPIYCSIGDSHWRDSKEWVSVGKTEILYALFRTRDSQNSEFERQQTVLFQRSSLKTRASRCQNKTKLLTNKAMLTSHVCMSVTSLTVLQTMHELVENCAWYGFTFLPSSPCSDEWVRSSGSCIVG